jgi:hypothetical protein
MNYEYVVWDNLDNCIHRGPWSEADCVEWLEECRDIFSPNADIGKVWSIRRRAVGEWETFELGGFVDD